VVVETVVETVPGGIFREDWWERYREQRYELLTWEERRAICDLVFGGADAAGKRLGVYVALTDGHWQYTLRGRCQLRQSGTVPDGSLGGVFYGIDEKDATYAGHFAEGDGAPAGDRDVRGRRLLDASGGPPAGGRGQSARCPPRAARPSPRLAEVAVP
jgi:hypothetical protein